MTALELLKQYHDFCTQVLSPSLDQECVDISYTPTQVWHPISWTAYKISYCTSECRPYSLLSLDSGVNCSPELLIVLWSGKPGSYIHNTGIHNMSFLLYTHIAKTVT